jgi:hypothetical protein
MMNLEPNDFRRIESIAKEGDLDCIFCCATLLAILPHHGQLRKDTPNGSWKHVPESSVTATCYDSTADVSSPPSKPSKSARRRKRRQAASATIDQSKADTGYSDVATQTNPVSPSLLPVQWPSSSIMNPATVFDFAPTSVPDGINASTQTEILPSESEVRQALTAEYMRYNDEIVAEAMGIAKRYRDLENCLESQRCDQSTITSLREQNEKLFDDNAKIFRAYEALDHYTSSEIARSADYDDSVSLTATDTSSLRSDYETESVYSRRVERNLLPEVEVPIGSRALWLSVPALGIGYGWREQSTDKRSQVKL